MAATRDTEPNELHAVDGSPARTRGVDYMWVTASTSVVVAPNRGKREVASGESVAVEQHDVSSVPSVRQCTPVYIACRGSNCMMRNRTAA